MANVALKARGSLLIWLDKDMVWLAPHDGSPAPDYSTLSRRQQTLAVQIPEPCADGPLNLRVDIEPVNATGSREPARGIKFHGDGAWQARKQGVQGRRQWRKVHLAMDTATSDIRAVESPPGSDGDSEPVSATGSTSKPSARPSRQETRIGKPPKSKSASH